MKKIFSVIFLSFLITTHTFANNYDDKKITIRNYSNTPMNFFILGSDNMEYFSDLLVTNEYSSATFVNKHSSNNFMLHAAAYPAVFSIAILEYFDPEEESEDKPHDKKPVCIVESARLSASEPAFGSEKHVFNLSDKFKCKVVFNSVINVTQIRKSIFSIFKK